MPAKPCTRLNSISAAKNSPANPSHLTPCLPQLAGLFPTMIHLALFLVSTVILAIFAITASILALWLVLLAFSAVFSLFSGLLQLILWPVYLISKLRQRLTRH